MNLFRKPHLFSSSSLIIFSATVIVVNCVYLDNIENLFNYDHTKDLTLENHKYKDLQMPRPDKVKFYLYPRSGHGDFYDELKAGHPETLANYDPTLPPIIIVHGFMQNSSSKHPQQLKNSFIDVKYPANIILADWGTVSQPKYGYTLNLAIGYAFATKYIDSFAKQIANFILFLVHNEVLPDPSYAHVIGFSLGGQIAGVTGSKVKKVTRGRKIGRITALDPAGANYHFKLNKESKLDKSDAEFVDVVHTAIVSYGYILPVGHVDFYPNGGGPLQPNCKALHDPKDLPGLPGSCSHARSWDYFVSSLYKDIVACKDVTYGGWKTKNVCDEPITFGQYTPRSARGVYFFDAIIHD